MSRPNFKPTEQQRKAVYTLSLIGLPHAHIAPILAISPNTLIKYFRKELERGLSEGVSKVALVALEMARSGKYPSMTKFWAETVVASLDNTIHPERKGPIGKTVSHDRLPPPPGTPYRVDKSGMYVTEYIWPDNRVVGDNGKHRRVRKPRRDAAGEGVD
jgi:hypothetical protein